MKKHLQIILAALLIICAFTGCAGQRNLAGQSSSPEHRNVSNTDNSSIATSEQEEMQDNSFSEEDYQKLLALRFDGYKNMTISNFRNCVSELTDTAEYQELLERFSKSETLYELKDTNETASFLFYILPLAGDEWKSRNYIGEVTGTDNARLEYSFTLTVLDADRLMIKDYNDTRLGVIKTMQTILINQTKEELQNDAAMRAYIQAYVDDFLPYMQTSELSVAIEFAYFPLQATEKEQQSSELDSSKELESRRYSNGTKDDYRSLLALKTPDYQNMPVSDFNSALLAWANEDHERMERIDEDTKWNDFPVTLTAEELSFVKMTVFLSGMENGKAIQSIYTGTEPYSPSYGEYLPEKITIRDAARCSLYYQFSYSISETESVTVGERDCQIEGMINAVQTFWSDMDVKSALKMSEGDIVEELEKIAAAYSNGHITITINKEKIHWECAENEDILQDAGKNKR